MMQRDIVDVLLKRVLEYSTRSEGSFTEDMARQIEREIRGDYGGSD
jgi:hypothetical protein